MSQTYTGKNNVPKAEYIDDNSTNIATPPAGVISSGYAANDVPANTTHNYLFNALAQQGAWLDNLGKSISYYVNIDGGSGDDTDTGLDNAHRLATVEEAINRLPQGCHATIYLYTATAAGLVEAQLDNDVSIYNSHVTFDQDAASGGAATRLDSVGYDDGANQFMTKINLYNSTIRFTADVPHVMSADGSNGWAANQAAVHQKSGKCLVIYESAIDIDMQDDGAGTYNNYILVDSACYSYGLVVPDSSCDIATGSSGYVILTSNTGNINAKELVLLTQQEGSGIDDSDYWISTLPDTQKVTQTAIWELALYSGTSRVTATAGTVSIAGGVNMVSRGAYPIQTRQSTLHLDDTPTGGTFRMRMRNSSGDIVETTTIAYDASAATVESAINGATGVACSAVNVAGAGSAITQVKVIWTDTFGAGYQIAGADVASLTSIDSAEVSWANDPHTDNMFLDTDFSDVIKTNAIDPNSDSEATIEGHFTSAFPWLITGEVDVAITTGGGDFQYMEIEMSDAMDLSIASCSLEGAAPDLHIVLRCKQPFQRLWRQPMVTTNIDSLIALVGLSDV